MSWEEKELVNVIDFYNNQRVPLSGIERSKIQGIYPYHGAQGIVDYINKYIFNGKYILVAEDGENLRSRNQDIARFASGKFWVNNHAHIIRGKSGICDDYFLKSILNLIDIGGYVTGAAQPKLSMTNLRRIKINLPPPKTQKRIADILSAYDDLIENNLKRIKLLEQAAQNIYKEWFVNMRFPGHENVEINEETGLPEGWKEDFLDNQLDKVKKRGKLKNDDYLEIGNFPIIDQSDGFIGGYSNNKEVVQFEPLPLVVFGDHTRRVKYVNFPFISGADGTQLLSPLNKNMLPAYFYLSIKSIDLSDYAYARHFKYLKQQTIIIPDNDILKLFNDKVYPMLEQNIKLLSYNQKLKAARDILLPRLMNRTIEV